MPDETLSRLSHGRMGHTYTHHAKHMKESDGVDLHGPGTDWLRSLRSSMPPPRCRTNELQVDNIVDSRFADYAEKWMWFNKQEAVQQTNDIAYITTKSLQTWMRLWLP